ncbi:MAG: DUF4105 domain-containing protein [Leptospirales bacterium]|jgi:hypothetical protein
MYFRFGFRRPPRSRRGLPGPDGFAVACTFVLILGAFASRSPLSAQSPAAPAARSLAEVQENYERFAAAITPAAAGDVLVELATVGPGPTPTTAFGHSALRIVSGEEFGRGDYYVDFGQYDESLGFLWRFLRGRARFYVTVGETGGALNSWDAAARGMLVTRLKLDAEQKTRLVRAVAEQLANQKEGYEYDNFYNNCVTYIRDVIDRSAGVKLSLNALDDRRVSPEDFEGVQNTWRGRTYVWSNENIWLYMNENLLFDPDTDRLREGHELIFMPDDLLLAVQQAGLTAETRVLVPHRHSHNPAVFYRYARIFESDVLQQLFPPQLNQFASGGYNSKLFFSALMFFIILAVLPHPRLAKYRIWGERAFALVFGLAGLYATLIRLATLFHFMDGTLIPLIFFPLDLLLFRNADRAADPAKWRRYQYLYGLFRLGTILLGIILAAFVWPQSILDLAFFALAFFALFTYNHRPAAALNKKEAIA